MAKPKILLIDADLKSRQMLEISLKKAGFTVTATEEGEKALQLLDTYRPDLIISDIDLAGTMNGYLFCQVLKERKEWKRIPFVFLTTRKEVEDKIRGLELGVDDYLTKPIYLKEVIARARIIVDKKKQENIDGPTGQELLFQGDLSQMSIVDLLQTMEFGQKTGILHLEKGDHTAKIYIKQGRVVHAVCDNLVGERAVYRTLLWNEGQFQIDFKKALQTQETIQVSTQALIMEGMRRIDELERIKEQLPPFDCYLVIDSDTILEEHPDRFPAKIENILAEFNGLQMLEQVVDSLPYDDLESLEIISKLYFQGYLIEYERPAAPPQVAADPEQTRTKISPGGQTLDTQMLQLDEASKSIEEIKAKARLASRQKEVAAPPVEDEGEPPAVMLHEPQPEPEVEESEFELAPPDHERQLEATPPVVERHSERPADPAPVQPVAPPPVPTKAPKAPQPQQEDPAQHLFTDDDGPAAPPPEKPRKAPPAPPPSRPAQAAPAIARIVPTAAPAETPPMRIAAAAQPARQPAPQPAQQAPASTRQATMPPPYPQAGAYGHGYAPPQPGNSTLTQFGENTMWQLGEATILNESAGGGNRRVVVAIAGALVATLLVLAIVIFRQQNDGGGGADDDIYSIAQRAYELVQSGEWASAQRLANEVLEEDPDVPMALYARGKAREQLGKMSDALADYRRAVEINPSFHMARYESIQLRHMQGDSPKALREELDQLLLKLDNRDPELYPRVLILALRLDIAEKNWPRARKSLQDAQAVAGNDPQLVILGGQIPAAEESVPEPKPVATAKTPAAKPAASPKPAKTATADAKPAAPAAVNASPRDEAKQLHEKGITFYRKGYLRNARRTLEDATRLDPENDEIWVDLGRVLVELGEDREAMQVFTTAGKIDPRNPRVWNNLGSLYMYQGDNERAKKAFETYLGLVPATSSEAREIKRVLDNL